MKIINAGMTDACMDRIRKGEIERIELDSDTVLEIRYMPEAPPQGAVGVRGKGTYIFTNGKE